MAITVGREFSTALAEGGQSNWLPYDGC